MTTWAGAKEIKLPAAPAAVALLESVIVLPEMAVMVWPPRPLPLTPLLPLRTSLANNPAALGTVSVPAPEAHAVGAISKRPLRVKLPVPLLTTDTTPPAVLLAIWLQIRGVLALE